MSSEKDKSWLIIVFMPLLMIACNTDVALVNREYPSLETKSVTEITKDGTTLNAEILNVGEAGIHDHGFVYSETAYPSLDKSDVISLGGKGERGIYSAVANRNLVEGTKYHVRAYAIAQSNSLVVYGQEIEFVSLGCVPPELDDFSPKTGIVGDTILLVGARFSDVLNNNRVLFGTEPSKVIDGSVDRLWCVVPPGVQPGENEISLTLGQYTLKYQDKFLLTK